MTNLKLHIAALSLAFIPALLHAQDAASGEREFRQCSACQSLDTGRNGAGPSLRGILGATSGQVEGFRYSDAVTEAAIIWDAETLTVFLDRPKGLYTEHNLAVSRHAQRRKDR